MTRSGREEAEAWAALQRRLGHTFANPALLQRALTHRSLSADHYERLEFLGDAVLGLVVATLLVQRLPQGREGDLSRARAALVRQDALHRIALQLGVPALVRLGEGERRSGGSTRPSILADVVEALLGAVYLDAGFEAALAVARRWYDEAQLGVAAGKDPKTALQEWLQARRRPLPRYEVVAVHGEAHAQTFEVACSVEGVAQPARGQGPSRRAAEQQAAAAMLQRLQDSAQHPAPASV
ncbi:Ribonuclease 3 [Tepidimonas alkaliphilus]|uniref:Ribonuclease 3 n=1 Tax=Tepidimonas alkaliphilus TaxID=2588942 RepID=A0A554W551_9BURK|nr:ribonuclease III [Tepidimonas alkaliphilus]TSE18700.1 Ribonuclease 3 [Tepidimonas alkaliphilus]